jgi:hypothetical protein
MIGVMKTTTKNDFKLFSNAGLSDNSSVFSRQFNFRISENQGFVVPWQMTEKRTTEKVEEQVSWYSHF